MQRGRRHHGVAVVTLSVQSGTLVHTCCVACGEARTRRAAMGSGHARPREPRSVRGRLGGRSAAGLHGSAPAVSPRSPTRRCSRRRTSGGTSWRVRRDRHSLGSPEDRLLHRTDKEAPLTAERDHLELHLEQKRDVPLSLLADDGKETHHNVFAIRRPVGGWLNEPTPPKAA